jgi:rhodanese-related sulfurtransferase
MIAMMAANKVERKLIFLLAVSVLASSAPAVLALDKSEVREEWHTPFDLYLSAQEANDMKVANPEDVLLIDVRTRAEIQFVGFADIADANIPVQVFNDEWNLKQDGVHGSYRKLHNLDFVEAVDNLIASRNKDKSVAIILMCASGTRTPLAADELYAADYQKVYFQVEGFEGIKAKQGPDQGKRVVNGWKNRGLPWSYRLPAEKMYFNFAPSAKP